MKRGVQKSSRPRQEEGNQPQTHVESGEKQEYIHIHEEEKENQ